MLVALGAVLVCTPVCKAQSEIKPDHFDGTDSWQAAATHKALSTKNDPAKTADLAQVRIKRVVSGPSLQLAAAPEGSQPVRQDAVAIRDKRSTTIPKSNQK